jgi:hypothetical protein
MKRPCFFMAAKETISFKREGSDKAKNLWLVIPIMTKV